MPDQVSCEAKEWQPVCDGTCTIAYSARLDCNRALQGLQAAGTTVLGRHWPSYGDAPATEIFSFDGGSELTTQQLAADEQDRYLIAGEAGPILLVESEGGVTGTGAFAFPDAQDVADARFEDGALYLLSAEPLPPGMSARQFKLWRARAGTSAELLLSYPAAGALWFVPGLPATTLVVFDSEISEQDEAARVESGLEFVAATGNPQALVAGPTGIISLETRDGGLRVFDESGTLRSHGTGWPACQGSLPEAHYPLLCEDLAQPQPRHELFGQVLAARLFHLNGHPWLGAILSDASFECILVTLNGCIETQTCRCGYEPAFDHKRTQLLLAQLDEPFREHRIELGGFPSAQRESSGSALLAVSTGGELAEFTVALSPDRSYSSSLHYLLIDGR
jgi:hypothetical protein